MLTVEAAPSLTDRELGAIARLVYEKSGITLHDGKRALVTARLQKRLRAGGFRTFSAYLEFVARDSSGGELAAMSTSAAQDVPGCANATVSSPAYSVRRPFLGQ